MYVVKHQVSLFFKNFLKLKTIRCEAYSFVKANSFTICSICSYHYPLHIKGLSQIKNSKGQLFSNSLSTIFLSNNKVFHLESFYWSPCIHLHNASCCVSNYLFFYFCNKTKFIIIYNSIAKTFLPVLAMGPF